MNKFINKIKEFIKKMTFKDWCLTLAIILAVSFGISSSHYKNKSESLEQSLISMTDSITTYKNKLGVEYTAKNAYIKTVKELKKENSDLSKELKNLKDNPVVITKTKIETRIDTIVMNSDSITTPSDSLRDLHWHFDNPDKYFYIKGKTSVKSDFSSFSTTVSNLTVPANIYTDVIEQKDGKLKIISRSDNPYVSILDTDGVIVDPTQSKAIKSRFKPKRWNIGPSVTFGVTSDMRLRPSLGISLTYGILQF